VNAPAWTTRVLVLHGGPVLRNRQSPAPTLDPDEGKDALEAVGLLAADRLSSPDPLGGRWARARRVPGRLERLLTSLVLDATFERGVGFTVPTRKLRAAAGKSKPITVETLLPYVVALRKELGGGSAKHPEGSPIIRVGHGEDRFGLNTRVVRCDWFDVLAAETAARMTSDPYERAYALSMAERAYVESLRLTPPEVVAAARARPPGHLAAVVRKRWDIRRAYVDALLEIGHTDTVVTEYRLWDELAREAAARETSPSAGLCSDEFFGLDVAGDAHEEGKGPLQELGEIRLGNKTLEEAAGDPASTAEAANAVTVPDAGKIVASLERRFEERRLQARERTAEEREQGDLLHESVSWKEVEALLTQIVQRLDGFPPNGFLPQIIVALGRGGSVVAAALSEMLPCRTVGFVSIDRYNHEDRPGSGLPFVRGYDLPDRRGCRVLVCDDIVTSGNTVKKAIEEVIRPRYPASQIVVASLVLNLKAQDFLKMSLPKVDVGWAAGVEVDVRRKEEFWVDFCWRMLRRPRDQDQPSS
jgi:hypoxanthine phosphoribosyltransferase